MQIYTCSDQRWHKMSIWRRLKYKGYIMDCQKTLFVNTRTDVREFNKCIISTYKQLGLHLWCGRCHFHPLCSAHPTAWPARQFCWDTTSCSGGMTWSPVGLSGWGASWSPRCLEGSDYPAQIGHTWQRLVSYKSVGYLLKCFMSSTATLISNHTHLAISRDNSIKVAQNRIHPPIFLPCIFMEILPSANTT